MLGGRFGQFQPAAFARHLRQGQQRQIGSIAGPDQLRGHGLHMPRQIGHQAQHHRLQPFAAFGRFGGVLLPGQRNMAVCHHQSILSQKEPGAGVFQFHHRPIAFERQQRSPLKRSERHPFGAEPLAQHPPGVRVAKPVHALQEHHVARRLRHHARACGAAAFQFFKAQAVHIQPRFQRLAQRVQIAGAKRLALCGDQRARHAVDLNRRFGKGVALQPVDLRLLPNHPGEQQDRGHDGHAEQDRGADGQPAHQPRRRARSLASGALSADFQVGQRVAHDLAYGLRDRLRA